MLLMAACAVSPGGMQDAAGFGSEGTSPQDTSTTTGGGLSDAETGEKLDVATNLDLGGAAASCDDIAGLETTMGCLFYPVDLSHLEEAKQYAVAVSNVASTSAEVVVEARGRDGVWDVVAGPVDVESLDLHVFPLPARQVAEGGLGRGGAYRLTSNAPIIAYQFNPLEGGSHSSDASLLYPAASWDSVNHVVGLPTTLMGGGHAYATIVAAHDGTVVQVTPTIQTRDTPSIPAVMPGEMLELNLDEGDIAMVVGEVDNEMLTGTRIISDEEHPVGVFTAQQCANIPHGVIYCDHFQEQLAGVRQWGKRFVAARAPARELPPVEPEDTFWQIYASKDGTTVTFAAANAITGLPNGPVQLQQGEVLELFVGGSAAEPGDFVVEADQPIAVLNYMISSGNLLSEGYMGDTSGVQLAPIEQHESRYVVLVPPEWDLDFAVVSRTAGIPVEIDEIAADEDLFVPVADGFEVGRLPVADGVHVIESAQAFSVALWGYRNADSYAYLGGSGTALINPDPEG